MSSSNKIRKLVTLNTVDVAQALQSLHIPGKVISANMSTGWIDVGQGNILRIQAGADIYIAFSDNTSGGVPSATTSPGLKLLTGDHYVLCQSRYVRASANPTRVELLEI
jgi:hypothetical protein